MSTDEKPKFVPPAPKLRPDGTPDLRRPDGSLPSLPPRALTEEERNMGWLERPPPKEGDIHTNRWAAVDAVSGKTAIIYCMDQGVAQMVADKHFGLTKACMASVTKIGYVEWVMLDRGTNKQRLVQKTVTTDPAYQTSPTDVDFGMGKPPQQ